VLLGSLFLTSILCGIGGIIGGLITVSVLLRQDRTLDLIPDGCTVILGWAGAFIIGGILQILLVWLLLDPQWASDSYWRLIVPAFALGINGSVTAIIGHRIMFKTLGFDQEDYRESQHSTFP
jgi:hypothetical protein